MMPEPEMRRHVRRYFEGAAADWAIKALKMYCSGSREDGSPLYSGAWFGRFADDRRPDAFTADDLVAVSMLSVKVPVHAAIRLLSTDSEHYSRLLHAIGPDRPIWESPPRDLENGSPASDLWHRLMGLYDVGPVIAGKLMAAKRPSPELLT